MKHTYGILIVLALNTASYCFSNNLIANTKQVYNEIKTIQGEFFQTICSEDDGTCQSFQGKFSIARPYYSRLEVTSPDKQLIVSDSTNLYIYLVAKKKVYVQSASAGVNFFKIFDLFLDDTMSFVITDQDTSRTVLQYKNDSLEQSSMFEGLTIEINNHTNLIEKFSYSDINTGEMSFELANIKVNPKLGSKTFKFEIPKGVEVLKY
jgi:chaperone LolA